MNVDPIMTYYSLSPLLSPLFKKTISKVKEISFLKMNEEEYLNAKYDNSDSLQTILSAYGVDLSVYWIYKFLMNTGIINSIEVIHFEHDFGVNLNLLVKLILDYTAIKVEIE